MRQYVVDAFTDHVFAGNPAAICVMDRWLDEKTMMAITIENNLSETAFAVKEGEKYHLRWFTPGGEIDLCGHATLGTACAIMTFVAPELTEITFTTLSGDLTVVRRGDLYEMDFPAYELKSVPVTQAMADAMNGAMPKAAYMGRDLLCVFDDDPVNECSGLLKAADGLIVGSPVYWHNLSGMLRNLLDRFYGPVREGSMSGKTLYFVFQGGAPTREMLDWGEYTMKRFAALYGMTYGGMATNKNEATKLGKNI